MREAETNFKIPKILIETQQFISYRSKKFPVSISALNSPGKKV